MTMSRVADPRKLVSLIVSPILVLCVLWFGVNFSFTEAELVAWQKFPATDNYDWDSEVFHRRLGEDSFEVESSRSSTDTTEEYGDSDVSRDIGTSSTDPSSEAFQDTISETSDSPATEGTSTSDSSSLELAEGEPSLLDLFSSDDSGSAAFGETSLGHFESEVFSFEEQTELDNEGHTNVSQCVVGTDVWNGYITIPLGRFSGESPSSTAAHLPVGQVVVVDVEVAADGPAASLSRFRMQGCVTDSTGEVKISCAQSNSAGKILHSEEVQLTEEVTLPFILEVSEIEPDELELPDENNVALSQDSLDGPTAVAYMTCVRLISFEANDLLLPWVLESFQQEFVDEDDQSDGSITQTIELVDTDDASLWNMFAAPFQSIAWLPQQMQKLLLRQASTDTSEGRRLEAAPLKNTEPSSGRSGAPPLIAVGSAIVVGVALLAAAAGVVRLKRGKGSISADECERTEPSALRPVTTASSAVGSSSRSHSKPTGCSELTIPSGCRAIIVESPSTAAVAHFVKTPRAAAWQPRDAAANPVPASSAALSSHASSSARSGQEVGACNTIEAD